MTYDEDPARWTSSPDEAPELLRGAFRAARNEEPSRNQMRSLALKLAAASAGGAVAVGTVKAASAGQTLATAASWSAGKISAVIAIAGTLVTGGALFWEAGSGSAPHAAERVVGGAPAAAPSADVEPLGTVGERSTDHRPEPGTPHVQPAQGSPIVEKLSAADGESRARQAGRVASGAEGAAVAKRATGSSVSGKNKSASALEAGAQDRNARATTAARAAPARASQRAAETAREPEVLKRSSEGPNAPPGEIELLRRAQVALTGRPREAFQLTQEHRKFYPAGEFAQERDALAIQALMRVGDSDKARELAAAFIRSYPSSPHAHRFREAMGLR